MRIAYADPPYIGQAKRHYSDDPKCAEVDHEKLIAELMTYDRWALSCSSKSLKYILSLCPDDVRIMPWVKPFASFKHVRIAYCYEPVIFYGIDEKYREGEHIIRDYVSAPMTTKTGVHGAKPKRFCKWLLDVLDVRPCDEFFDLYPGSKAVTRAWNQRRTQQTLMEVPA